MSVDIASLEQTPLSSPTAASRRLSVADRWARQLVLGQFACLRQGAVTVVEGVERQTFGDASDEGLRATITVNDSRLYRALALGGSIASGETYMRGLWTCDDLTALVRIFVRNRELLDGLESGARWWRTPLQTLRHRLRRNSRRGSRQNIQAHYDLGNGFFALFLDETLMYSCGVFETETSTLREASVAKNELLCRKLQLSPQDHLLEIGTGWGGFALHAAANYGCRITTTTISREQHELARRRIAEAGLADRVEVLLKDYRDFGPAWNGRFDKLVSIEMIEAVGEAFLDGYFAVCHRLLKPGGRMALQAITIPDQQYDSYRRTVDFIQRYIFPGGFLPSIGAICGSLGRATSLHLTHLEDLAPHYARTLACWRERFLANLDSVREQGFPETFIRMWEFYLCYCEGAFRERGSGCVQLVLQKV